MARQYYADATGALTVIGTTAGVQVSPEGPTYSTNEINTGMTWIDGKPIYRKTFDNYSPGNLNGLATGSTKSYGIGAMLGISDFNFLISH